ncbi:hypothetical protein FOPE_00145 [Fonsecaea pedrosoi]|nr:hypothetical protein FOPE_00145 [Fonsecaea pedrosoi]
MVSPERLKQAFSIEPNLNWSRFYTSGNEIYEKINPSGKFGFKKNGEEERVELFDVVLSAKGLSSQWDCSSIPGIHEFEGHKVHSASWDNTYDYSYKRIGIIGNGSSSIQFLPEMVKLEGTTVVSFQSGPTYITSSIGEILGVNAGELGVNTVETNMENASGHNSTEEMEDDDGDADSTFKPKVSKASQTILCNGQREVSPVS